MNKSCNSGCPCLVSEHEQHRSKIFSSKCNAGLFYHAWGILFYSWYLIVCFKIINCYWSLSRHFGSDSISGVLYKLLGINCVGFYNKATKAVLVHEFGHLIKVNRDCWSNFLPTFVLKHVCLDSNFWYGCVAVSVWIKWKFNWLFATPWTAACQASLFFTISWSLLKVMSISQWCHPIISSSFILFSSCLQSFPASRSFLRSWLFASGGQSIGGSVSGSVLPVNIQGWVLLGLTFLISLQSKWLSRVFAINFFVIVWQKKVTLSGWI